MRNETTPDWSGGRGPMPAFTAKQLAVLDAITARLVPSDQGSGAAEAGVVRYIDSALAKDYASLRPCYAAGIARLDEYCTATFGREFTSLTHPEQDATLGALERDEVDGFFPSSRVFFEMVRQHTLEGMFGDPGWGGNAGGSGWRLLGYGGPRMSWSVEDQRTEAVHRGPAPAVE